MINAVQALAVVLIIGAALVLAKLIAPYLVAVYNRKPSRLDKIFNPIENFIYKIIGVDTEQTMGWKQYFLAALYVNIAMIIIAFLIMVFQGSLPLNPMHFPDIHPDLAFMQAVSFATNTDLQHYSGEATFSYLSQISVLQWLQFASPITGICVGIAFIRGLIPTSKDMGNFYVDFTRSITRIFLPLAFVASIVLLALGVPQTLSGYTTLTTIQGASQTILSGPVASLDGIMQLGTNGGGFYGANAAYPFMNPSQFTDVIMILLMLLLPLALLFVFGEMIGKKRESIPLIGGTLILGGACLALAFSPSLPAVGPGIETRFGGFSSTLWTVITTMCTTGSVNASLSGIHPLGITSGFLGMFIQSIPGGKGVGMMYMVMFVLITVFVVGLMSGRTPEYLSVKITGRDVMLVMVAFLLHPITTLIPTVTAYASGAAASIGVNGSSTGFTQILWEFTSAAANNGSDFLGAQANTPFFNIACAIVILVGRYGPILILLALSGSMIGRKRTGTTTGLKTDTLLFTVVLVVSIIILVVLSFFPFLAIGPISSFFGGLKNGF